MDVVSVVLGTLAVVAGVVVGLVAGTARAILECDQVESDSDSDVTRPR